MKFTDCVYITGESCKKYNGNKNYISTGAVDEDHIDQSQVESVSYDSKPSRANLITDDNSILFAKMQSTKKTLLINQELKENVYSTGFFSVAPKENILNRKCLYHLLASKTFLNQKDKYCSGATQKAITLEGLNKIEINIPKFEEQKSIAKKLDAIKQMISSYNEILNKYDELIKARFIEMFDDAPVKKIEDVCESFKIGPFGSALHKNEISDNGYSFVLGTDNAVKNEFAYDEIRYINEEKYHQLENYKVNPGEIIMSMMGTVGRVAIIPENIGTAIISSHLCILRVNKNIMLPEFFHLAFCKDNNIQFQIEGIHNGSIMKGFNLKIVKAFEIKCPNIKEQKEFVKFAKQADKSKLVVQKSLEKTQQLFDSLMQEYFG